MIIISIDLMTMENPIGTYYTHHNYSRPYRVVVSDIENTDTDNRSIIPDVDMNNDGSLINDTPHTYKVRVCGYIGDDVATRLPRYSDLPCVDMETNQLFIGKSPRDAEGTSRGAYGSGFDGNTILFREVSNGSTDDRHQHPYIYIGKNIIRFYAKGRIIRYRSDVGNGDWPYPFAIDEFGYMYLFDAGVVIAPASNSVNDGINDGTIDGTIDDLDIYKYYYEKRMMAIMIGEEQDRRTYMGIHSLCVNDTIYTLSYDPVPEAIKTYDRITSDGALYAKMDSFRVQLSKEWYLELMRIYGAEHGFEHLEIFEINSAV